MGGVEGKGAKGFLSRHDFGRIPENPEYICLKNTGVTILGAP